MEKVISWLFDNTQYVAILQKTIYGTLIKESSAVDATTTVVNP